MEKVSDLMYDLAGVLVSTGDLKVVIHIKTPSGPLEVEFLGASEVRGEKVLLIG